MAQGRRNFVVVADADQLAQIRGFLSGMSLAMQSDILANAFAYAGKPIVSAARGYAKASQDTGLLARSLGVFVKKNRRTKEPYALLTASGRLRQKVTRKSGKVEIANPQKYLHLVDLGTRHSASQRILERALQSRGGEAGQRIAKGVERATDAMIRKYERKLTRTILPKSRR